MFQLTASEAAASRSHFSILKAKRGSNIKYLPFVFTAHGAIQAVNVLRPQRAIDMGIYVGRAFVRLRRLLASNSELAIKCAELERKVSSHDQAIVGILKTIRELMNPAPVKKRPIGFAADLDELK